MPQAIRIALVGDQNPSVTAHRAIPLALALSADELDVAVEATWFGTETIDAAAPEFSSFHGIWCVPASPYRQMAGALAAIRHARTNSLPYLGTCAGFQHAVVEYARNVLDLRDADHAETNPDGSTLVIAPLSCSLVEVRGTVHLVAGSRLATAYGRESVEEPYHCNFGMAPQ